MRNKVTTGIAFGNELFPLWDSMIAAGATLKEIYQVWQGGYYSGNFLAAVIAWKQISDQISLHSSDAQAADMKRRTK